MDRKSNSNTFALVAGIMFALCGMIILIQSIRYGGFDSDIGLDLFSLFGLAAALFLKKHEAVLGMALVSALSILILVIKYSLVFFTSITAYLLSYLYIIWEDRAGDSSPYDRHLPNTGHKVIIE